MPKSIQPIPDGFHTVTPHLVVRGAQKFIALAKEALGAEHLHSMPGPDGKSIMHAALRLGDSTLFLADASDQSPPTTTNMFVYVKDVDAAYARATKAGCTPVVPVADMFWGDRWGVVADPFGNQWQLATHVEDVSTEVAQQRMNAMFG